MAKSLQASQIGQALRAALSRELSNVMLETSASIEAACPVKTGHLRSNFVLTTGARYGGVDGSPRAVSHSAQQAGKSKIVNYDIAKDGPKIFLANNVSYLPLQRGFVTFALQDGVRRIPHGSNERLKKIMGSMKHAAFKAGV